MKNSHNVRLTGSAVSPKLTQGFYSKSHFSCLGFVSQPKFSNLTSVTLGDGQVSLLFQ